MSTSTIDVKKKSIGTDILRSMGGVFSGTAIEYIKEAMPNTSKTIDEAKNTASEVKTVLSSTTSSISSIVNKLKSQYSFKNIDKWFKNKEDEFDYDNIADNYSFDGEIDEESFSSIQISEYEKNANKISKAVVESTHMLAESQLSTIANVGEMINQQNALISAGFEKTNATLESILNVVTKNTSAMIELSSIKQHTKPSEELFSSGFNLKDYKKALSKNIMGSQYGMVLPYIQMILDPNMQENLFSGDPKDLMKDISKGILKNRINKYAPNLKKNLSSLDRDISDTMLSSLIKMGNNNKFGLSGQLMRLFGIDASRKDNTPEKSSLSLKSISYDTLSREALTSAIPGYLRKILVAVGGNDEIYDYTTRKFVTKANLSERFRNLSAQSGTFSRASNRVQDIIGYNKFNSATYDLMMNNMGAQIENAHDIVTSFKNPKDAEKYLLGLYRGQKLDKNSLANIKIMAAQLSRLGGLGEQDLVIQASRQNYERNRKLSEFNDRMDAYNVDISHIKDNYQEDKNHILRKNYGKSSISGIDSGHTNTGGVSYSNIVLFEIYRRLNKGINVFQVGRNNTMDKKFKGFRKLKPPAGYRPETDTDVSTISITSDLNRDYGPNGSREREENILNDKDLPLGERLGKWGNKRGGDFIHAMMKGSPEEVRAAFGAMVGDISGVGKEKFKGKLNDISDKYGNVKGYLKHKLTGKGYTYDDNGEERIIADNKKGGILGFLKGELGGMYNNGKDYTSKWFNQVKGYFNYGGKDKEEKNIAGKRKKLLATSIGAFTGMGILGGPIGLLVGSIAGSALSSGGFGEKLKNKLFGRDDETGKAKGLLTKAFDKVTRPIQYQIEKTFHHIGSGLKKNIFGPLSDLGLAIKDRITTRVDTTFHKYIVDPIKGVAKKLGGALLKGIGKVGSTLFQGGVGAFGEYKRKQFDVKSGTFGAVTEGLAWSIAGKHSGHYETDENGEKVWVSTREANAKRRKERAADAKKERSNYGKNGYSDFNTRKDLEAAGRKKRFKEYTSEEIVEKTSNTISEEEAKTREAIQNNSEIANETKNAVLNLNELGSHAGSIYTHDIHIEERLDTIIKMMGGISPYNDNTSQDYDKWKKYRQLPSAVDNNSGFANSAVGAAMTLGMSGETIGPSESRNINDIISEAQNPNSNKGKITQRLRSLITMQQKNSEENVDKKESFISKLFGFLGGFSDKFGLIATSIAGIATFSDFKSLYNDVIKGDMSFSEWWGEESNIGKSIKGLMDISRFIGKAGAPIVNSMSSAFTGIAKLVPFVPDLEFPQIDGEGPFAGLAVSTLGGLYFKGIGAVASIASAAANVISAAKGNGSSIINNAKNLLTTASGKSTLLGKGLSTAAAVAPFALGAYSIAKGGLKHDELNAAGNEIVDQASTRAANHIMVKGTGQYLLGMTDSVGGPFYEQFVKRRAKDQMIDAAQAAVKHGTGDGLEAATKALTDVATSSGLDASKLISSKQTGKIVEKAVSTVTDEVSSPGFLSKAVNIVKSVLKKFFELIKNTKAIKAIDGSAKYIDDLVAKVLKYFNVDALKPLRNKIYKIIVKQEAEDATKTNPIPIGILIFGIGGAASGASTAANIFNVRESDVTPGMRIIASAIVGALNASPKVGYLEMVDLVLVPCTGISLRQMVCQFLYAKLFGQEDTLNEAQGKMEDLRTSYNSKFGANLSSNEYNDMVNSSLAGQLWHGSTMIDDDGNYLFDDAGNPLQTAGIKGLFVGGHKEYVKDEFGNVIKGKDGKAIVQKDANGRTKLNDKRWGNYIGDFFSGIKRWVTGGDIYETDKDGNAIYDSSTGEFKVKEHKDNILKRTAGKLGFKDGKTEKGSIADIGIKASRALSTMALSPLTGIFSTIELFRKEKEEKDENGKPLLDEDGKPIKKGKLSDYVFKSIGFINGMLTNPFKTVMDSIKGIKLGKSDDNKDGVGGPASSYAASAGSYNNTESNISASSYAASSGLNESIPDMQKVTKAKKAALSGANELVNIANYNTKMGGNPLSRNYKITNVFGEDKLGRGDHKGIDIVSSDGINDGVNVTSRYSGTIEQIKSNVDNDDTARQGPNGNWRYQGRNETGNMVVIRTDDGFIIKNMHLKAGSIPSTLKVGDKVNIGTKLGLMGSTGWSTSPHLHYQIEDPYGNPIDPTDSVANGGPLKASTSTSSSDVDGYTSPDVMASEDSSVAGSSSGSGSSVSGGSGPLGQLLSALTNAGNAFLGKLTGGLFGSSGEEAGSTIDTSTGSSGSYINSPVSSYAAASGASSITTAPNSQWIDIVRKVKSAVANQQPIYYGEPGSFTVKLNVNGKQLSMRPDCSGLVGAMLKIYGAIPEDQNITSSSLLSSNAIPDKFDMIQWPGWDSLVEGDIMSRSGHVEIFGKNEGGSHMVYNGGSTNALCSPGLTYTSHKDGYQVVWRCRESSDISLPGTLISGVQSAINIANNVTGGGRLGGAAAAAPASKKGIYDHLRKLGYTDIAAAAIMGVWEKESSNLPNKIEGDFIKSFPGHDKVLSSNEAMDDYALNKLFPATEKNVSIDRNSYMSNGHYYPGIGLAQWTGPRADKLLTYLKSKNKAWNDFYGQTEYFNQEMINNERKITPGDLNSETNLDAATKLFANKFEGTYKSDWILARQQSARDIYNQFGGDQGLGGEVSGSKIGKSNYISNKNNNSRIDRSVKSTPSIKINNRIPNNIPINITDHDNINNKEVVTLLNKVISCLEAITSNTGESNGLLTSLNQKDFVDQGLRNSFNAMGKSSKKHYTRHMNMNPNNNRLITSLARP